MGMGKGKGPRVAMSTWRWAVLGVLVLLVAAPQGLQRANAQTAADEEEAAAGNARQPAPPRKAAVETVEELDYDSNFGSPVASEVEVRA